MRAVATSICQTVADRLLEGDKVTGDPALVEHVGSCLDCFRTLTELRDVPRITEALRADAARSPLGEDPGPAFWNALPGRVVDQVLGPRQPARPARARWWTPAALLSAGLGAAALALFLVSHPVVPGQKLPAGTVAAPAAMASGTAGATADSDDDPRAGDLASLGASELRALSQRLSQDESAAVRALASDDDMEGGALEQLASLDGPELRRLTDALGKDLQ